MFYAATLRAREAAAYMREPTTLATRLAHLRDLALNAAPRAPEPPIQDLLDLHIHDGTTWLGIDDDLRVMIGEESLDRLLGTSKANGWAPERHSMPRRERGGGESGAMDFIRCGPLGRASALSGTAGVPYLGGSPIRLARQAVRGCPTDPAISDTRGVWVGALWDTPFWPS